MSPTKARVKKPLNPWDAAQSWDVVRGNALGPPAQLEPGVKFFVLQLERLGCTTVFSCQGHPDGFYVTFTGPLSAARAVAGCGYLTVEVERAPDTYRLSLQANELGYLRQGAPWTDAVRESCLRGAAAAWETTFGRLSPPPPARLPDESLMEYKARLRELGLLGNYKKVP